MAIFQIEGEEIIDKTVRPRIGGSSAQIYIHKKYTGKRVKVVILSGNGDGSQVRTEEEEGVEGVLGEKGDEGFA